MDSKAGLKLGTFVKNEVLRNPEFKKYTQTLGIDRYTEPSYVLDAFKSEASPEDFTKLLNVVKGSAVKEFINILEKQ